MECLIRCEELKDYEQVNRVVKNAFYREDKDSKFSEWALIERIRESEFYIKELSIVAECEEVVGHIMFTPMKLINNEKEYSTLALAPVAVEPKYQNRGIGHKLIQEGIEQAKKLGYGSIIVLGHPKFYTKFGFEKASKWRIGLDEDYNSDYLFALELFEGALENVSGIVKYCAPFYSEEGELI